MSRIIAVANQKGGVGKTTTSINLSAALAEEGKKVLVIDTDPQGNTTSGIGVDKRQVEKSVYQLLIGDATASECIVKEVYPNLSLLPANENLAAAEIELIGLPNNNYILRDEIEKVKDNYDFILIDCPPSLSILTINAMTTADGVLVPIQCEYYALEGLSQLMKTVNLVKSRLSPKLGMEGVVFTMYDSRTNLSNQVIESVTSNFSYHVYNTVIPRSIRLAEAPSYGEPICQYDPKSTGTEAYRKLAQEIISRNY